VSHKGFGGRDYRMRTPPVAFGWGSQCFYSAQSNGTPKGRRGKSSSDTTLTPAAVPSMAPLFRRRPYKPPQNFVLQSIGGSLCLPLLQNGACPFPCTPLLHALMLVTHTNREILTRHCQLNW
jgi:hypothetical protein